MAEDVIALLNYVGWTGHRDLHVVGISLGGMIAQGMLCRTIVVVAWAYPPSQNLLRGYLNVSSL